MEPNRHDSRSAPTAKLLAAIGLLVIATGGLPIFALGQDAPLSARPDNGVQLNEGIGGAGYAVPADVYVPPSSVERPEDAGQYAHTTYLIKSSGGIAPAASAKIPDGETPSSMECVYGIKGKYSSGCGKSVSGAETTSGWGTIALVDAYDNPDAASDYTTFSKEFHLPTTGFTKVYANGNSDCTTPAPNASWAVEESLDIEWAHAMAPAAKIILVEACTNSLTDLLYAETVAAGLVATTGGDISNSWGSAEFSGETSDDSFFFYNQDPAVSDIVFFASADDAGCGAAYPSSSPWIVSAGGTTVNRLSNGKLNTATPEGCWSGSGGGTSAYESNSEANPFQYPIFGTAARATPDFAFNADPNSGVDVYSQYGAGGWLVVGGTSLSSPALAGIVNSANNRLGSYFLPAANPKGFFYNEENELLYAQLPTQTAYKTNFYDITTGSNGCFVGTSWDYCTGVGSPRGYLGK